MLPNSTPNPTSHWGWAYSIKMYEWGCTNWYEVARKTKTYELLRDWVGNAYNSGTAQSALLVTGNFAYQPQGGESEKESCVVLP